MVAKAKKYWFTSMYWAAIIEIDIELATCADLEERRLLIEERKLCELFLA